MAVKKTKKKADAVSGPDNKGKFMTSTQKVKAMQASGKLPKKLPKIPKSSATARKSKKKK